MLSSVVLFPPRLAVAGALFLFLSLPSLAFGQQAKGDKELGIDGAALITNSKPVTGNVFADVSLGRYFSANSYIGVDVAPTFSFGSGSTSGGVFLLGEYRYLLGREKAKKVWPFVGAQGGYDAQKSGGSWQNIGLGAPEGGIKVYVTQRSAFEVSYHLYVLFGSGISGSFANRSENEILFGFKHLF